MHRYSECYKGTSVETGWCLLMAYSDASTIGDILITTNVPQDAVRWWDREGKIRCVKIDAFSPDLLATIPVILGSHCSDNMTTGYIHCCISFSIPSFNFISSPSPAIGDAQGYCISNLSLNHTLQEDNPQNICVGVTTTTYGHCKSKLVTLF